MAHRVQRSVLLIVCVMSSIAATARAQDAGAFDYFDGLRFDRAIPTPQQHLGYAIGEHFTRHADAVRYCRALAAASDRVTIQTYGQTYSRRPLVALTITSPANHAKLNAILSRNLELTDPRKTSQVRADEIASTNPAIVWLSYNVHGNEASSTETAMQVAYTLAASTNDEIQRTLDDLVIVIDPCLNPDGHERYVNFFNDRVGEQLNPADRAAEHDEPWPSGRANHYLFDLNRDWTWCSQAESQARLPLFRTYKPQLHIDYHEQGHDSPYFLGAGDAPYNANIPEETKEWLALYGRANGEVFDKHGLVYATRERFDYLYPGYGKVTPVYHGAVSLLCEQAGHGMAGLAITVDDEHGPGLVLTLQDRARNHFLTSMSYLETTVAHREQQLQRFARFYRESMEVPAGETTAFIFAATNDPEKLARVRTLCGRHGIEIEEFIEARELSDLRTYLPPFEAGESVTIDVGAWVIRAGQPMGRLARVIFERETFVEDRDTYDITSWPVPAMMGLDAYEYSGDISSLPLQALGTQDEMQHASVLPFREGTIATLVPSDQAAFVQAIAAATKHNLFARLTGKEMVFASPTGDISAPSGSLLIHHARNQILAASDGRMESFASDIESLGLRIFTADRGVPIEGPALGNNANRRFIAPKIALLRGSPLSSLSFGHTWHMLDIQQPVPHDVINVDALRRVDLDDYNVIVIPSANASRLKRELGDGIIDDLRDWVRSGGTVITLAGASDFAMADFFKADEDDEKTDDDEDDDEPKANELTYEERRERRVDKRIPGAVLAASIDTTHPIAAGLSGDVAFHAFSAEPLHIEDEGYVIARFMAEPRIGGSINGKNLAKLASTPAVTMHRMGGGNVICFTSDPTNRAMNQAGMQLLLNCITLGPSMAPGLQPLGEDASHEHDIDADVH